jgi:ABC-type dipeptide/oligopeptide/nickel transport system permease component
MMWAIPTLFVITFLVFIAIRIGTDPVASYVRLNPRATPAKIQQYKDANGLNGSYVEQYFSWLWNFVRFDWGNSIKGNRPVWPSLKAAMANTIVLGTLSVSIGISIGLVIGIVAAMRPRSLFDHTATTGAFIGVSIPPYVTAILLQLFFAITLTRWLDLDKPLLPTSGVYPAGHSG